MGVQITGVIPEEYMDSNRIGDVIAWLKRFPIPGRDKAELLQAWRTAVGAKVSSSQFAAVQNSGIEVT